MCEVANKSPSIFLQAYSPIRLPVAARKIFNAAVNAFPKPRKLA